jgi:phage baseplate assembly protein W
MPTKYINIKYPFSDSKNGFLLELNSDPNQAIKSDLLHLIFTQKGQRLYNPDFGTNLIKFIFEPNDEITYASVLDEIKTVIKKFLPNLSFKQLEIAPVDDSDYAAIITIEYIITEGIFETQEIIKIKI